MFGLDYVTGPPIADLKAAGVMFVCRYLSFVNELTKVKLLSASEAQALCAAGIAIVSNYEWYDNRALEGVASGVQDAQIAAEQHAACGGPADRPIYFSVDCDCDGAQTTDYFRGVASVLGLARTGAYGSYRVIQYLLDHRLIQWAWQTYAWSNGQWDAQAHIQQYKNGVMLAGHEVDYNRSIKPDFGQWLVGGQNLQTYTEHSADFGAYFKATDTGHWTCTRAGLSLGKVVQFGIKKLYQQLSLDGNTLPVIGLPVTNELYLTLPGGKQIVLQVFERAGVYYDPGHLKDKQPGTGECSLCHLGDIDFLKNVPGLALPTQPGSVDTTALVAAINAIADGIAPAVAQALVEAKKL